MSDNASHLFVYTASYGSIESNASESNQTLPNYLHVFIQDNHKTLTDIYDAGKHVNGDGMLMIECDIPNNDAKVYFVGKEQLIEMGKEDLWEDGANKLYYIIDKSTNRVHLVKVP